MFHWLGLFVSRTVTVLMQEVIMPCRAMHHRDPISVLSVLNNLMKRERGSISVMAVYEGLAMTNQLGFMSKTSIRILI